MKLQKSFRFEAAHSLPNVPEGHKCGRLHGHSFEVVVWLEGEIDSQAGWLQDFGEITKIVNPIVAQLDHRLLNEIVGLENPTSENLAIWLWDHTASSLPLLSAIEVRETCTSGCVYSARQVPVDARVSIATEGGHSTTVERGLEDVPSDQAVRFIAQELSSWRPAPDDIDKIATMTARTLDTVSRLTQYEDEKANRILAAVAFISAFVASTFATIPNRFPPLYVRTLWMQGVEWRAALLATSYLLLAAYAVLVSIGLSYVLWAVMPRFKSSLGWITNDGGAKTPGWGKTCDGKPKSVLFFSRIVETHPTMWAREFRTSDGYELALKYSRDSIAESHLIADKIRDKVRFLTIGVRFFFSAATIVALLMLSVVLNLAITPPPSVIPPAVSVTLEKAPSERPAPTSSPREAVSASIKSRK